MSQQLKNDLKIFITVFKQFMVAILSARASIYINQNPSKKG